MTHRMSVAERKRQKMKEIQRKLTYMRAASPPKSLLHSTSRLALAAQNKELERAGPTKTADQLIERGILRDDYYLHLKQTVSPQRICTTASRSPTVINEATSFEDTSPPAAAAVERTPSSRGETPQAASVSRHPDYSQHPLVDILSANSLTKEASKRKLQANVKRLVESSLAT